MQAHGRESSMGVLSQVSTSQNTREWGLHSEEKRALTFFICERSGSFWETPCFCFFFVTLHAFQYCLIRLRVTLTWDWWDGWGVKSTGCPSRGPGFDPRHPHDSLQQSVTPAPEHLYHGQLSHAWYINTYTEKRPIHIKMNTIVKNFRTMVLLNNYKNNGMLNSTTGQKPRLAFSHTRSSLSSSFSTSSSFWPSSSKTTEDGATHWLLGSSSTATMSSCTALFRCLIPCISICGNQ